MNYTRVFGGWENDDKNGEDHMARCDDLLAEWTNSITRMIGTGL